MSNSFTKRKFLRQLGILGAVGSVTPFLSGACLYQNRVTKWDRTKLGVALVGLGGYSTYQLAPALQLTRHCELRGIVTGTPSKITNWQERYNIPDNNVYNYDNMHEIADNGDIDVVYIVVPTGLHAKYAIRAAETGKHVWCEKPMAMNVSECEAIIEACEKNRVRLAIGYRVLHEPNMQEIIRLTRTQKFGPVNALSAVAGYAGGVNDSWRFKKNLGGGALYDMGVYTVNGMRHAGQLEPIGVISASHSTTRPEAFNEVDETTEYRLEFPEGVEGYGKTSVGESFNRLEVTCKEGSYFLAPMQTYNGLKGERSDGVKINYQVESQQALQMDDDALAIKNEQPFIAQGIDGLKDVRIIEAIFKSAQMGGYVRI